MKTKYDMVAALRIYPGVSKEPVYFANNKIEMVTRMLSTFITSINNLTVKFHIILDNCPNEYIDLIDTYLKDQDYIIHQLTSEGGNFNTFLKQIDLLLNQEDSDFIMFAEDDYLYREAMLEKCVRFLQNDDVDFVAPYDHNDYYSLWLHQHPVKVRVAEGLHWRMANSTTLTFLTKKEVLKKTHRYFRTFAKKNWDCSIFWTLTKYHIFNPISFFYFVSQAIKGNSFYLKIWLRCWYFTPLANFITPKYTLWSPITSAATHLQEGGIAPNIDWTPIAYQPDPKQEQS